MASKEQAEQATFFPAGKGWPWRRLVNGKVNTVDP